MNNVLIIIDQYLFFHFSPKSMKMANFFYQFLDANALLYNSQSGFRHNYHSTSHAIITLIEKISKALDIGKIVCGIFIDFRKAFNVVPHKTLLKKLYAYGIRGEIYNWLKSYLSQFVQYQNSKSGTKLITHVSLTLCLYARSRFRSK